MCPCNICGQPWHESTGHYISPTMRWCGPCTKSWVKELCGNQHRRWGGERFYDHATVPPAPKLESWTFRFMPFTRVGDTTSYVDTVVVAEGVNEADARRNAEEQINDPSRRMWMNYETKYGPEASK